MACIRKKGGDELMLGKNNLDLCQNDNNLGVVVYKYLGPRIADGVFSRYSVRFNSRALPSPNFHFRLTICAR